MLLQAQQMICTLHIKTSIQSSVLWFLIKFLVLKLLLHDN
jgi:hypothetical protein